MTEQLSDARIVVGEKAVFDRRGGKVSEFKTREARLRRAAARQGLAVEKSRRRTATPGYRIVDPQTEAVVRDGASGDHSLTIEQAEAFLGDPQKAKSITVANLNAANDK